MIRKSIVPCLLTLAAVCLAAPAAHAQLKVGTVDMNQVFTSYYKTKDAEAKINEARQTAKKDLDGRIETLKKAMEEINKLNQNLEKPELSKDGKDQFAKQRDEKIQEARALDRDLAEFRQAKERELQERYLRMRKDLIDDIMVVVQEKVKGNSYDLVVDKSAVSLGQIPIVLFSRSEFDFSNDVVAALNKTAPKPTSAAN